MNLRQEAEKAARKLIKKVGTNNLETIAEFLDIEISNEEFPDKISGAYYNKGKRLFIGVNKTHDERRKRFTIAHELGHHILHGADVFHYDKMSKDDIELPRRYRMERDNDVIDYDEVQANVFAAELLMPSEKVEKSFISTRSVIALAEEFNVSEQAMEYRLLNLGLL